MKLKFSFLLSLLAIAGCSSEYSPEELEISPKGMFVERGTDSLIDGVFLVEKETGESLEVEFEGGLPNGGVEMRNEKGDVILRSNFVNRAKQKSVGFGAGFVNEMLKEAGALSTKDYLDLFEDFAEYNGDYLEVSRSNKKIQGSYKKGEKVGRWQEYCENEQLESDLTYKEFNNGNDVVIRKIGKEQQLTCDGDLLVLANRDKDGRLQGEYLENYSNRSYSGLGGENETSDKPKQKYIRNYKDGEFDGTQKEFNSNGVLTKESVFKNGVLDGLQKKYDQNGEIILENNFKNAVKNGEEKIYSSKKNYTTNETIHWLSEVKNYTGGKLNGKYQQFDQLDRSLQSGAYEEGLEVGLWEVNNYSKGTKRITDYDSANFTLEKSQPFKEACYLPTNHIQKIDWSKKREASLKDCQYYVEKGLIDVNKKIALDQQKEFKYSNHWTYPAVVATPAVYDYMKSRGVNTRIADSAGRTRLHFCIAQFRSQSSKKPRCNIDQVIAYMDDVDLNSVSNVGTLFHQLAEPYRYIAKKALPALVDNERKIAETLISKGADINKVNHQRKTALVAAIENQNYYMAEFLIDAGASIEDNNPSEKTILGYFFLSSNNKLKKSALSTDATRVLAKMIALGLNAKGVALGNKTIQTLSEENNKLFHIQTLNDAIAMSEKFSEDLKNRPKIAVVKNDDDIHVKPKFVFGSQTSKVDETKLSLSQQSSDEAGVPSEFIEAKKSLLSDSTGSENTVDQVKLLEQPKEEVRSNVEQLLSEEAKNAEKLNDVAELLKEQADFLVAQANEHIANFRLKTPKNNSALGSLEQLKRIDPENENIAVIEKSIGEKYLGLTIKKIEEGQKSAAQHHLNSASEFIKDEAVLVDYQAKVEATKRYTPPVSVEPSTIQGDDTYQSSATVVPIACDPVVSFSGVPLIGGQLFTAQQLLPVSASSALEKSAKAVRLTYNRVVVSRDKITYEQATSTKPIKFTLTVTPSGNYSQITIKAKSPTGIVLKKSGYKKGFCDLLEKF